MMHLDRTRDLSAISRFDRRRLLVGAATGALVAMGGVSMGRSRSALARATDETGFLRVACSQQDSRPEGTDPMLSQGAVSVWLHGAIYDQLLRLGPDGTTLEPGLAASWEASDDGLVYTFQLREAVFHDEAPVTADDVVFTLDRVMADPYYAQIGWPTIVATAVDPRTVRLQLDRPTPLMPRVLADRQVSILPRRPVEERQALFFQEPVGSGPFALVSWKPGVEAVLKRNPPYWKTGKPALAGLHLFLEEDGAKRVAMLTVGAVDVAAFVPFDRVAGIGDGGGLRVASDPLWSVNGPIINLRRPPFDDRALRQAMNLAIDRDAIVAEVYARIAAPATWYLPPGVPGGGEATTRWTYDLDRARSLVAASTAKDGFRGEMIVPAEEPLWSVSAKVIADHLKEIGGDITIVKLPMEDVGGRISTGEYDLLPNTWIGGDAHDYVAWMVSDGCCNLGGYHNAEIDRLAADGVTATDPAERAAISTRIGEIVHEDPPMLYVVHEHAATALNERVHDLRVLPNRTVRWWDVRLDGNG